LIRNAEAPAQPPHRTLLLIPDDASHIEAAISFFIEMPGPETLHVHLNVLARHLDCKGARYGDVAYERFVLEALDAIYAEQSVSAALLTAEAHVENLPVQRLIEDRGWQCMGPANAEGYAPWALPLAID